ncbi:hypothetical protein C0J52_00804 [Blattella germanica]|nr:hypothetical protein C0J52_00804 [Blattella germanica]PSN58477.1 hypothetical protein C0J52_00804 [Blattella germanica]
MDIFVYVASNKLLNTFSLPVQLLKKRYVLKGHLDCCKISFTKPLSCIFQKTCCSRQFSNFISHVHKSLKFPS